MTRVAVLGLGEAGSRYAVGLASAGAQVQGYDPAAGPVDARVRRADDLASAVAGADVVLSLVGAASALEVAVQALPHVAPGAVYADLNTGSPELKAAIASAAEGEDVAVADVAVLAPVTRAAERTPLLVSGPGAAAFASALRPLGVPVETLEGPAGEAARLKLLRSAFMKGLAALVIESVRAARAAGAEDWLRGQIAAEFGPDGDALVDRLIEGTYTHAVRREREVRETLAALTQAGQPGDMTSATLAWFQRIVAERREGSPQEDR